MSKQKKSRKGKKFNRMPFIHAAFKQATLESYTMNGCCLDAPVMTKVGIEKSQLPFFAHWVAETRFEWKTWMCVFARNQLGHEYTKIEVRTTPTPMNSDEASAYMTVYLHKLVDSVNPEHLVSTGYVNTYNNADLEGSSDDLVNMFVEYGAFDVEHCVNTAAKVMTIKALEMAA